MRNLNGIEENTILGLAEALEERGNEWVNRFRDDDNYINNSNVILEVSLEDKCSIHTAKKLECMKMGVPFWWKGKENATVIKIPVNYCKYCQHFIR